MGMFSPNHYCSDLAWIYKHKETGKEILLTCSYEDEKLTPFYLRNAIMESDKWELIGSEDCCDTYNLNERHIRSWQEIKYLKQLRKKLLKEYWDNKNKGSE